MAANRRLLTYYERQLSDPTISISRNTEVTAAFVSALHPDLVVVAAGASTDPGEIEGWESAVLATDLRDLSRLPGPEMIVVGGGLVGCDIALALAENKKTVTILESSPEIVPHLAPLVRESMRGHLESAGVRIRASTTFMRLLNDTAGMIRTESDSETQLVASHFVLATGSLPRSNLGAALHAQGITFREIGDCRRASGLLGAIHAGFHCASCL